jgi:RimJ/RimL family protein N-acetyltransferase
MVESSGSHSHSAANLRPFVSADVAAIFERWAQDPEVWRYLRARPRMAPEQTQQAVQRAIDRRRKGTALSWMLTLSTDNVVLVAGRPTVIWPN